MHHKLKFSLCFFAHLFLCSSMFSHTDLPRIIDLKESHPFINQSSSSIHRSIYETSKGAFGFEKHLNCKGGPEFIPLFVFLQEEYPIDILIETGTWEGDTTRVFSQIFKQVYSIERAEDKYNRCMRKLRRFPNIRLFLGSSEIVLSQLLPDLKNQFPLFYLDAHSCAESPLLEELNEISKTHKNNCIIVIDDVKVPGRPDIAYDTFTEGDCSYEIVESKLKEIFTEFSYHYIVPKCTKLRAKLIVIPNNKL